MSSVQKVAVIGASSMVGSRFCELQRSFDLIKADLKGATSVDITSAESVKDFFQNHEFTTAILFSAFTNVDGAELQRNDKLGRCWRINVEGTKNITSSCSQFGKKLIFISTETVFDGEAGPYKEDDEVGIDEKLSWYGVSKKYAEKEVEKLGNSLTIRICYPYRASFKSKLDFARNILKKAEEGTLYPMFSDQLITPTFIDDLAPSLELLISGNQSGVFHVASPAITSPYEFAKCLLEKFGLNIDQLKNSSIAEFAKNAKSAPRPVKGGLLTEKISLVGFVPTSWQQGIDKIFGQTGGKLI